MTRREYNGFSPAQREAASRWAMPLYASGERVWPIVCQACGSTEHVAPHSEDYSTPYGDHIGAFALCRKCHYAVHTRFTHPDRFRLRCEAVLAGALPHQRGIPMPEDVLGDIDAGKYAPEG